MRFVNCDVSQLYKSVVLGMNCSSDGGLNRVSRVLRSRRQRKYAPGNCNGGATMYAKLAEQCGHVNFNCALGQI